MIIECARGKIREVVSAAERITGKNLSLPILANIFIQAENRWLKIKATNLDLGLELTLPAKISQPGVAAVSGSLLLSFLNSLPPSEEKIKLEVLNGNLHLTAPLYSTTIKGQSTEDFPVLPLVDQPKTFLINSSQLLEALRKVWYSASISNLKPEISSVCFYQYDGQICLVATDSFRLAEKKLNLKLNKTDLPQLIIPRRNIIEIMKIFESNDLDLEVQYNAHQLAFKADNFYLTTHLIDGVYPDYRQIIPQQWETEVIIKRHQLLEVLKIASVFSDKFSQADLTVNPGQPLEIKTRSDQGENITWCQTLAVTGAPVVLSFNLKYLGDGLQTITDENLIWQFNGSAKPTMIRGQSDQSFLYLVMPIRR